VSNFQNRFKVWLEIDAEAVKNNIAFFRSQLASSTQLWAVVKSNAYGHGLDTFSRLADHYGVDGFCVDSVIEGRALRNLGIKKPILILGPTLSADFHELAKYWDITETISNWDLLKDPAFLKFQPPFHLKVETGMHRQGFEIYNLTKVIDFIKEKGLPLKGVYSHFAAANPEHRDFTEQQFNNFQTAVSIVKSQLSNVALTAHIAATGGALLDKKYHLDAVRIGLGLYGYLPFANFTSYEDVKLGAAMRWKALISEIKELQPGDYVGYDLTEQVQRPTRMAIIPIGYWHGLPRALSSVGEVIVQPFGAAQSKKARVLGRVCMDVTMIDVTGIDCQVCDPVEILPLSVAEKTNGSIYEILTRINPLLYRKLL